MRLFRQKPHNEVGMTHTRQERRCEEERRSNLDQLRKHKMELLRCARNDALNGKALSNPRNDTTWNRRIYYYLTEVSALYQLFFHQVN